MDNKVTKEIFNPINENIKKLESLFPEIVKDGQVDFEALRQELGQFEEVGKEKYELTWPGKTQAKQLANTDIIGRTLKYIPEDSKNPETTENLYIEGDNLEVLKLLRNSYYGKVKMIYIDPPYNTGNDFVYKDNFTMEVIENEKIEGNRDEEGNRLIKNQEGSGRFHSNWLNMMYPRLKIAKDLLKEYGVIFISIDDNEVDNLRKMCSEIFGEQNLVAQFPWQSRQSIQNDTDISNSHEYIVAYAKVRRQENRRLKESNADSWFKLNSFVCLPLPLEKDNFDNPDNDPRGLWKADPFDAPNIRPNLTYIIKNPNTGEEFLPPSGRHWRTEQKTYEKLLADNRIIFGKTGNSRPQLKVFYEEKKMFGSVDNTWWTGEKCGTSTQGTKEQIQLFEGFAPFDTPKPVKLLTKILSLVSLPSNNDIILDFFSGSGTTAHAVMKLNAEDKGKRKFIMVQIPEEIDGKHEAHKAGYKNICEIGKERIRRASEKIKEELKDNENIENLDIGFKVFKVADTNIRWNSEVLKEGQITMEESALKNKDLIDFNPGFTDIDVVYEIMLRHRDFPLTSKIEKLSNIGERTYIFADAIVVCLEEKVTEKIVDGIAAIEPKPIKVIFRDSAFEDDISLKLNTMNRLDAQLKKHNQGKEQSYRVEFI